MKKYLVFVLLFCLLFITGCDLINQMTCEHNLIVIEATESTCSTKGTIITRCDKCTYTKTEEKPLLPHDYGNQETISPDCNNDGYTLQTCKVCNYQEKTNIIPNDNANELPLLSKITLNNVINAITNTPNTQPINVVNNRLFTIELSQK